MRKHRVWSLIPVAAMGLIGLTAGAGSLPSTEIVPASAGSTPFLATTFDLARDDYTEDEYFVEGSTNLYAYDENNNVIVTDTGVGYKTRMLIRRPIQPSRFNGTVIVEWLNPTAGFDGDTIWLNNYRWMIREGAIWVGVTIKPVSSFLPFWNPERYEGLFMPDISSIWDAMGDIAVLFKSSSPENPLWHFGVERIIAAGYSQSANYLMTYANEFHENARIHGKSAHDGYFIAAGSFRPKQINTADEDAGVQYEDERRFITVAAPVIRMQTETEVVGFPSYPARQPQSPTYRLYEMAGGAHVDQRSNELLFGTAWARDLGTAPVTCDNEINPIPIGHLETSALRNLDWWIRFGIEPPPNGLIELDFSTDPPTIVRDEFGNALGGVRLPQINVPLGNYLPSNTGSGFCFLFGSFVPFDQQTLSELYRNRGDYVRRIVREVRRSLRERHLIPSDAVETIIDAAQADAFD